MQKVNNTKQKLVKKDIGILIKHQPPPIFNSKVSELCDF
jgi:hypothetical protein